jgi:hypothetical protein
LRTFPEDDAAFGLCSRPQQDGVFRQDLALRFLKRGPLMAEGDGKKKVTIRQTVPDIALLFLSGVIFFLGFVLFPETVRKFADVPEFWLNPFSRWGLGLPREIWIFASGAVALGTLVETVAGPGRERRWGLVPLFGAALLCAGFQCVVLAAIALQ